MRPAPAERAGLRRAGTGPRLHGGGGRRRRVEWPGPRDRAGPRTGPVTAAGRMLGGARPRLGTAGTPDQGPGGQGGRGAPCRFGGRVGVGGGGFTTFILWGAVSCEGG